MGSMNYCLFENAAADLEVCRDHILEDLPDVETEARERLIELCRGIVTAVDASKPLITMYPKRSGR